jgi:hypothetical protein
MIHFIRRISPMHCFPARWTRSLAAAALLTLPLAASAQTSDTKVDAAASKRHLSAARDTLSQLTSMPEAARIQGDARTQVSQIISNFNQLITTQSDWRSAYAKVDTGLIAVLGPEAAADPAAPVSGVAGAVGTAGSAAASLDPAVRAKLVEFRAHLKEFERAAGGASSGAMPPTVATDATATNPVNPATNPAANPPADPPSAAPAPPDQAKAAVQAGHSEADKHLDAIAAILDQATTGALTAAQTTTLKKHVEELRLLLKHKSGFLY